MSSILALKVKGQKRPVLLDLELVASRGNMKRRHGDVPVVSAIQLDITGAPATAFPI